MALEDWHLQLQKVMLRDEPDRHHMIHLRALASREAANAAPSLMKCCQQLRLRPVQLLFKVAGQLFLASQRFERLKQTISGYPLVQLLSPSPLCMRLRPSFTWTFIRLACQVVANAFLVAWILMGDYGLLFSTRSPRVLLNRLNRLKCLHRTTSMSRCTQACSWCTLPRRPLESEIPWHDYLRTEGNRERFTRLSWTYSLWWMGMVDGSLPVSIRLHAWRAEQRG